MSPLQSTSQIPILTIHVGVLEVGYFVLSSGVLVQHSRGSMFGVQDFINSIFLLLVLFHT